ncbi:MAG: tRNA (adenosine(37)-N6)-dimethylallyltransferase MiaA [Deltaproteobacteria bacterium]|nr:tRNA (adenosine(37)-N6)-dimethylallyltransferase MiaA [Deltaproteobacteria bacterium]
MGPTASGKSALAVALCQRLGGELVTVDSAQVFRGLDVGTAKPTPEERAAVPHHLIDVIEPTEQWSAAQFAAAADQVIAEVRGRGRVPILCGGTGLWMRALVRGIFEAPDIDPEVRARIRGELLTLGPVALHARLAAVDPEAAGRIQPTDPQRIGRALEVYETTGTPISALQAEHGFREARYRLVGVALEWPRDALNARIEARARAMYARGMVEETAAALAKGVPPDAPGLAIIGYRDAVRLLAGEIDRAEAERSTVVATRRYAKRQRNWFNHEPDVHWISPELDPEQVLEHLRARGAAG